jgi:hypothetical protein
VAVDVRTIWGDNDAATSQTYWETFQNRYYVAGDSAHRDKGRLFWIMGRIDDVLKVAASCSAPMEIESRWSRIRRWPKRRWSASRTRSRANRCSHSWCCAASARRGDRIERFTKELRDWVTEQLGAIARPDDIRFADNLPKTRSGKIMRRLLRAIARNEDITQDLSTLENPAIIDQLRGRRRAPKKPRQRSRARAPKKKSSGAKEDQAQSGRPLRSKSAPRKKSRAETGPQEAAQRKKPHAARRSAPRQEARGATEK